MKFGEIAGGLGCEPEGDAESKSPALPGFGSRAKASSPSSPIANIVPRSRPRAPRRCSSRATPARSAWRRCARPSTYLDFARAIEILPRCSSLSARRAFLSGRSHKSAKIGQGAHIGPYCFVDENVELGDHAVLHSFVSIYRGARIGDDFFAHAHACVRESCQIGNRVLLQNGVVVGSDGYGFARESNGHWYKMRQAGITVIGDDVEIQAHSAIDRATIGETRIGRGTKIDNLVQVGHASTVGEDTLLCGRVGLAGTTHVGNRCILAGQVGAARASHNRRRRHVDRAERSAHRRSRERRLFRLSRHGQSRVAEICGGLQSPAGFAARPARAARRSRSPPRWRETLGVRK